jgi:hypothetical protein
MCLCISLYNNSAHTVIKVFVLPTCEKHIIHERFISLLWEASVYNTGLASPLMNEVSVPGHESEQSCTCVGGVEVDCMYLRFSNSIFGTSCAIFFRYTPSSHLE